MAAMSCAATSSRVVPSRTSARALVQRRVTSSRGGRPLRAPRTAAGATADAASADASAADPNLDPAVHEAVYASDTWGPWEPPLIPLDPRPPLLAFDGARALLEARDAGATRAAISLDFNTGPDAELRLDDRGVFLDPPPLSDRQPADVNDACPDDAENTDDAPVSSSDSEMCDDLPIATWSDVAVVAADVKGAYVLRRGARASRFQVFSEDTGRAASLMPVGGGFAPTALLAGFSMHRFGVGVDPMEDTERKLAAIAPIRPGARVLDVCTGLAYTASGAARRGAEVTTVELDRAMTLMCRMNPHSAELFSGNIRQLYGNGADVVPTLPDASFDRIVHDPPTFALAGELFSETFYAHLLRVLKPKGVLYHYIGDPASKSAGNVAKGAAARLKKAGFGGVVIDYEAHGILAARGRVKPGGSRGKKKPKSDKRKPITKRAGAEKNARREKRGRGGRGGGSRRDDDEDETFLDNEFY
jgi:predicted methyltransferase